MVKSTVSKRKHTVRNWPPPSDTTGSFPSAPPPPPSSAPTLAELTARGAIVGDAKPAGAPAAPPPPTVAQPVVAREAPAPLALLDPRADALTAAGADQAPVDLPRRSMPSLADVLRWTIPPLPEQALRRRKIAYAVMALIALGVLVELAVLALG